MENSDLIQRIKNAKNPTIVYFSASWCMPCKMMAPAHENVRHDYGDRVEFIKLDADTHTDILKQLSVYGIPTMLGYNNGVEVLRRTGAQSGIAPVDRYLRLGTGLAIMLYGWFSAGSLLLTFVGGVIAFSAIYDRCPIIKTLTSTVKELWKKIKV